MQTSIAQRWATSILTLAITIKPAFAQSPDPASLRFEVASVRQSEGGDSHEWGGPGTFDSEIKNYENVGLARFLQAAYGVESDQIVGPAWIGSEVYTLSAKIAPDTTQAEFAIMMQNLLTDRFHLAFHRESKVLPVYELTIAKSGAKLTPAAPRDWTSNLPQVVGASAPVDRKGCPVLRPGITGGTGKIDSSGVICDRQVNVSLASVVRQFVSVMNAHNRVYFVPIHIVDKTGLSGNFDITLHFVYPAMRFGRGDAAYVPIPPSADDSAPAGSYPFEAMEQQLGIKVRETKEPIDVIVIDHIDRVPTDN